jgi:predicted deacylase
VTDNLLKVGTLTVAPGGKAVGVEELKIGEQAVRFPIFVVNGAQPGPTLAVTAGIHGAEFASIEAALQVGRAITPERLAGRLIIVAVANMPAFLARAIYVCPLDGKNLNRVFPGQADGTAAEQIAFWLFENVIRQADYYVDMHGGDLIEALVPFTIYHDSGNPAVNQASLEIARAFGIPYILRSESLGGTFSAAARAGIPAILTEAGGQGIWRPRDVKWHMDGLNRLMRHLGMIKGARPRPVATREFAQSFWLRSDHEGYWYPAVSVGETVHLGQDLGHVADFQGNVLQPVACPADGVVLFLVSSLAINPGDPLLSVGA